jgi:hypothetical protein
MSKAKLKLWMFTVLTVLCLCLLVYPAQSQPTPLSPAKQTLARAVLIETGIARRYDLYLRNSVESLTMPYNSDRFLAWLHSLFVREAGWKQVETSYLQQVSSRFTDAELQELQTIFKRPVVKKLLEAEAQSYASTSKDRRQAFFKVWDNYNRGLYNTPSGL